MRYKRSTQERSLTSPARTTAPHVKKNVDRYGTTKLGKAAEKGDLEAVKQAYEQSPDELNQPDYAGIAPLQKASLKGHAGVVAYLIKQGCRPDVQDDQGDTPLIDAVTNGELDVVRILLKHGVNPHHSNSNGQRAMDFLE
ncbi:ankyrin, partial [Eremomyces bilateralis CBS 781.70]